MLMQPDSSLFSGCQRDFSVPGYMVPETLEIFLYRPGMPPPLLKTILTEAVTTQQDNGILKYITTNRAGAVQFRL